MSKSLIPVLAAPADAPKAETKAEVEVDITTTAKADADADADADTDADVPKAETLANTPPKIEEVRVVPCHVSLYHSYSLSLTH